MALLVRQVLAGREGVLAVICMLPFLFYPTVCLGESTVVPVVAVLDGDTIEVLHNRHPERIRLSGIDCPEKGQAYGHKAKEAASALVFGKEVVLQTHGKDKYGRTLADVLLLEGVNVNHELVKEGWCWCWWYRKYAPADSVLGKTREGRTRHEARIMGRPASGATVGVATVERATVTD